VGLAHHGGDPSPHHHRGGPTGEARHTGAGLLLRECGGGGLGGLARLLLALAFLLFFLPLSLLTLLVLLQDLRWVPRVSEGDWASEAGAFLRPRK
jgi:hypothetical protein